MGKIRKNFAVSFICKNKFKLMLMVGLALFVWAMLPAATTSLNTSQLCGVRNSGVHVHITEDGITSLRSQYDIVLFKDGELFLGADSDAHWILPSGTSLYAVVATPHDGNYEVLRENFVIGCQNEIRIEMIPKEKPHEESTIVMDYNMDEMESVAISDYNIEEYMNN